MVFARRVLFNNQLIYDSQVPVGFFFPEFFSLIKVNTLPFVFNIILMAYWLVKSEPSVYSWEQFEKDKQTFLGWGAQLCRPQSFKNNEKRRRSIVLSQ